MARRIAFCTGDSATAGIISRQVIDIPHYADGSFKVASSRSQVMSATGAGSYEQDLVDVWHITTAAINRLTFTPEIGANWIAGSRIDLYGSF